MSSTYLIAKGNSYISSRQSAASKLIDKVFKVQLGRGFYGECLVITYLSFSIHVCYYIFPLCGMNRVPIFHSLFV